MKILTVKNIEKYYGNINHDHIVKALDGVSFEVEQSEFVGIMGASGSGKTTLLNCVSTIDQVTSGHIYLDDKDISDISDKEISKFRRENLGFIFQDFNLLDTLNVSENISLALAINKVNHKEIDRNVNKLAKTLGVSDILDKFPYEISGGQKQRVACARAFIHHPKLILADEPTGALDSKSTQNLLEVMTKMNQELNATILMVTHDIFAASYCSRILFLKDGQICNEIYKGNKTRKEYFNEIVDVVTLLGGENNAS